jgi:hypothetical protein
LSGLHRHRGRSWKATPPESFTTFSKSNAAKPEGFAA